MVHVVHLDIDHVGVEACVAGVEAQVDDVGLVRADDRGEHAQRTGLVLYHHRDARGGALGLVAPGYVDPGGLVVRTVGKFTQHRALDRMHLDPGIGTAHADDAVAGHRVAAFGEFIGDARRQPLDRDRAGLRRQFGDVGAGRSGHQRLHHRRIRDGAARDGDHQLAFVRHLQPLQRLGKRIRADLRGQALDDILVQLGAQRHLLGAFRLAQMAADRGQRLAGDRDVQPVDLRRLSGRAQDLHLVAIVDHRRQGDDAAVDLGAHRLIAQRGVHGIGEVDRGGPLGQLDQLALGREGEDAILIHRHARVFEQLLGAVGGVEDLDQIANPAHLLVVAGRLLVGPVRGQPVIGLGMHFGSADLDFHARVAGMDHAGVQRAIAVALGRRDIVLEPPRHHRPAAMDDAKRAVAILLGRHDGAERHHVRKLLETDVPFGHLAEDRIGMLFAARHLRLHAGAREQQLQVQCDAVDPVVATFLHLRQPAGDRLICLGFELLEGERLHLLHELVHADPLGERGIDVHRLLRDAPALLGFRDVVQGAHIVQPVGQLHQQHADVVRHGEQELAQVFRRALVLGLRLDLGQLGHAVHQPRDIGPEQPLDLLGRGDGVLDRVVQDRGGDRHIVQMQVGQDARHLDRMAEIRVAGGPFLAAMRLHGKDIGAVQQRLVGLWIVVEHAVDEFILAEHTP